MNRINRSRSIFRSRSNVPSRTGRMYIGVQLVDVGENESLSLLLLRWFDRVVKQNMNR